MVEMLKFCAIMYIVLLGIIIMFIPILTILYDYDCYLVEGTKAKLKYLLQVTISGVIGFTVMYAWIALVVAIGYYVFFIKLGWVR